MLASIYLATDTGVPTIIRNTILGALGGIIGLVSAIWLGYVISDARTARAEPSPQIERVPAMPTDPRDPKTNIPPNASGNFNFDQRGGTVNQTYINQAQPRLRLTDALKGNLLSRIPKDKKINVQVIGSTSDIQVGIQINEFLKSKGYSTDLMTVGMRIPPPDHALSWEPGNSTLVIAPSVRD